MILFVSAWSASSGFSTTHPFTNETIRAQNLLTRENLQDELIRVWQRTGKTVLLQDIAHAITDGGPKAIVCERGECQRQAEAERAQRHRLILTAAS